MKKVLFLLSFLCLYVAGSHAAATARIMAYDLRLTTEGENYTFTFKANEAPTEATLVFYSVGTGKIIGEKPLAGIVKGANSVTLSRNQLPGGGTMNWGVKLHAGAIENFEVIHTGTDLKKCHLTIDNSPESDYFGRIYIANRQGSASGGIYVYNQDYSVHTSNTLAGQTKWQSMGRPAVGADGTVYIGDWGDDHGGVYVMNPATLTATCFFDGTQNASTGLWTNAGGNAMGSSTASVGVYGSGASTVLYAMNEDVSTAGTTLYEHGVNVYQIGQPDGSIKSSWNTIPTRTFALLDNTAQMFVINATSKGAFFSCSRAKPNNSAGARSLQFYNTSGTRKYVALPEGATADLTGSMGGGCAISRDEKTLAIVDGDGNILVYSIAWTDDVPELTKVTKYTTSYAALGSLCFDYAGNILVTAGANYNNSTANKMVVYTVPTDDNTCTVPAKKSLTVYAPLSGTFNIGGADANYTSLFAATADINKCGISADVNLLVGEDLTVPVNPVIVNNTSHSITIRPDANTKRTISFTAAKDNYGPSGNFVIGGVRETISGVDTIGWNSSTANNIIIDGSYNGEGQFLEFRGGNAGGRTIVFYGAATNCAIKNCRVINPRASGTNYAIEIRTAKTSDNHPANIIVANNYLEAIGSENTQAIVINGSGKQTAAGLPLNTKIQNNHIKARLRGVFFNEAKDTEIEGNIFEITNAPSGYLAHAIMGSNQSGTITVKNNSFSTNESANAKDVGQNSQHATYGLECITASGGGSWIIENNYFGGMATTAAGVTTKNVRHTYIYCINECVIRHNTFHMPALAKAPATAMVGNEAISCVWLAGSNSYMVKNNLFVSAETTANNSLIRGALNSNVQGNVFYHAGGNAAVVAGDATYTAFSDLPSSYQSTNKSQQVAFETGSYKFTDEYTNNFNLGVERIEGLNYDIEGNVRNYPTRAGCYDPAWCLTLDQTATDNTDLLTGADGIMVDAVIKRSFGNDGWYTLVLPFDATVEQLTEVFGEGYKVAVLKDSRWKSETDLYLNFEQQSTIEAGVPCLIKPATSTGSEIVFHNVTIDKDLQSIETDVVDMIGLYNQTTVTLDADNYYLGNGNLLYEYNTEYASSYALTNGFRAYFHFNFPLPAGCSARVTFREDTATEIEDLQEATTPVVKKVLRDEQLIIIRDGKEYNVQGQLVR